jgi:DNA repair exonuclease SbcCD ATPase subunit
MKSERNTVASLEARIKRLETALTNVQDALEHLEKRMLLRLRGEQYCRVCGCSGGRRAPRNPPLSELEKTFCKANHGLGRKAKAKPKPQRLPLNWEEVERLAR